MAFFPPSRSAQQARRRLIASTIFVVVVVLADFVSGGRLRLAVGSAFSAVWRAGTAIRHAIGDSGAFATRAALQREIDALRAQLQQTEARDIAYNIVKEENDSLRALAHVAQTERGVAAPITSSVSSSPYGTFMISAGTSDGVRIGDIVVADPAGGADIALGRIGSAGAHSSLVVEVLAPQTSADALLKGASVTAEGRGGGNGYIKLARGVGAAPGDIVRSPQLGGRTIGIVAEVKGDPASAYQDVYFSVPFSINSLQYVYVVSR